MRQSSAEPIAAARLMGADMAYVGTRFMTTRESLAAQAHKDLRIESKAAGKRAMREKAARSVG